jgi:hypothetical protein
MSTVTFTFNIYKGKVKSSRLAYNRREIRDKRPLGRDLDRSWCHLYTSVKLLWSQPMAPKTSATAYECVAAQSMNPWAATKKALHWRGGDTGSCLDPYPMAACPEFHVGCYYFSPCSCIYESFIIKLEPIKSQKYYN